MAENGIFKAIGRGSEKFAKNGGKWPKVAENGQKGPKNTPWLIGA